MESEDEGFVYAPWISSLRGHPPFKFMTYHEFSRMQRQTIDDLRAREGVRVLIAVEEKVGEPKFGWICYEWQRPVFVLHYVYIRNIYRKKRIASRLLEKVGVVIGETPIVATALTKAITYHIERWKLDFNPYAGWRKTNHKDCSGASGAGRNPGGVEERDAAAPEVQEHQPGEG
jgi:hypothetical protein